MLFLSLTTLMSQLSGLQAEIVCCAKALGGKSPTCEGCEGFLYDFPVDSWPTVGKGLS